MNKEQQMYMDQQNHYADLNKKAQEEIREELSKIPFPFDELTFDELIIERFGEIAGSVMPVCSLERLKCDLDVYRQLLDGNYNLFSITFLLNAIQSISPKELEMSPNDYTEVISLCYTLGKIHSEHAKPIQTAIHEKYQKMADEFSNKMTIQNAKAQKMKNKKVIPFNRK